MPLDILAVGDLHLGRSPIGLPHGYEPGNFSPRAAWSATVEHAIQRRVDAVVLLGDVVDHDRDFIEAYSALKQGAERLVKAGIAVIAVVGNHDVFVLPRLAKEIRGLQLIGAGGAWEEIQFERAGRGAVRFVGWSFPSATVRQDPLDSLTLRPRAGVATVGLVHGELGVASSHHAPLSRERLVATGFDAWLLGHIHRPSLGESQDRVGYLGSLVGLDPGEPGVHGPWLVRVNGPGAVTCEQLPLAPIRWESVELALTPDMDADAAEEALPRTLLAHFAAPGANWGEAKLVAVRLRVTDSTNHGVAILARLNQQIGVPISIGSYDCFVETIIDRTRPDRDLVALAKADYAVGGLAKRMLALEGEGDAGERGRLLREARKAIEPLHTKPCFMQLVAPEPTDDELAEILLQQGRKLLEQLLERKEAGG